MCVTNRNIYIVFFFSKHVINCVKCPISTIFDKQF